MKVTVNEKEGILPWGWGHLASGSIARAVKTKDIRDPEKFR